MELTNDFRVAVPVERAWQVLTDVERIAPCMPGAQLQEIEGEQYRGIVKVKVGPISAQYKGQATFVDRDEAGGRLVLRAEGRETRGQGNASATITATLTADGDGTAVSVVTDLTVTGRVAQFGRGVLADVSSKLLAQFVDCLEATVLVDEAAPAAAVEPTAEEGAEPGEPAEGAEPGEGAEPAEPEEPASEHAAAGDAAPAVAEAEEPVVDEAKPEGSTADGPGEPALPERPSPASAPRPAPTATRSASGPEGIRRIDSPEPEAVDLLGTAGSPVAKRLAPVAAALTVLWLLRRLLRRRARRRGR